MKGHIRTLLLLTLILSACSPTALAPEAVPPAASEPPVSIPAAVPSTEIPPTEILPISTTLSTPHIDQGPDGAPTLSDYYSRNCGYQWAYQDLPELSADFQLSIQTLQTEAQGHAFGFGENCVYADGTATFIPMETDFNVTIQVSDLADETTLGEWIVKIMQVIENIPPDQIIGPRPGRVGIIFESNGERQSAGFYIDQYHALPAGLSHAEIYQTLKTGQ